MFLCSCGKFTKKKTNKSRKDDYNSSFPELKLLCTNYIVHLKHPIGLELILTFTDKNLQTSYKFKSAAHVLQLMEQQSVVKMNQTEIDWRVTPGNFVGDYISRGLHI